MPQIIWDDGKLMFAWKSADDIRNFVEQTIRGPAKQLGLEIVVTETAKNPVPGGTPQQIELVRL